MPNTDIFSDLSQDDLIKIERLLENILINIDGIAGRKAILKNARFAQYFIASLDFNLNIYAMKKLQTTRGSFRSQGY